MLSSAADGQLLQSFMRSKILLVGRGRAGKSSTKDALMGKAFEPQKRSTVGCEQSEVRLRGQQSQGWMEMAKGEELERLVCMALQQEDKAADGGDKVAR